MENQNFLTVKEALKALKPKFSINQIYRWIKSHKLKAKKQNGIWTILESDLEKFAKQENLQIKRRDFVEEMEVEFDIDKKTLIHLLKKTILEDLDLPPHIFTARES